jgi:DNA-binding transcriptional regulator LsrR (DeoR family)
VPSMEQTVRAWYDAGHSQRAIARELNLDRRKVRRIIDQAV